MKKFLFIIIILIGIVTLFLCKDNINNVNRKILNYDLFSFNK